MIATIKDLFDQDAGDYDRARRKLIPCFDDFYGMVLTIAPDVRQDPIEILDLGAGTGLLSAMLAAAYPQARLTLLDLSPRMLAEAEKRLARFTGRVRFIAGDYAAPGAIAGYYGLIVSALSIHHLENDAKENLWREIFHHLAPGGLFVNADQVRGETPASEHLYREQWLQQVRERGATAAELTGACARMEADRMATLGWQLDGLRSAGFREVHCWYRNLSFAVWSGRKASGSS